MSRLQGFTIVELMIALAVAAIILTMAAPATTALVRDGRVRAQTFDLMGDINFARSQAIKRKVLVVLCRSQDPTATTPTCGGTANTWTTGWLIFASLNGNNTYENGVDTLLAIGEAVSSLKVITNSTSNRNLEYSPDGTTNESGGTARFAICDSRGGAYGRQVNVSPIGRPVIAKGSTGAPVNCTSPS
jgi:type IV fimbrial biogenesis protein FimT